MRLGIYIIIFLLLLQPATGRDVMVTGNGTETFILDVHSKAEFHVVISLIGWYSENQTLNFSYSTKNFETISLDGNNNSQVIGDKVVGSLGDREAVTNYHRVMDDFPEDISLYVIIELETTLSMSVFVNVMVTDEGSAGFLNNTHPYVRIAIFPLVILILLVILYSWNKSKNYDLTE